MSTFIPAPAQRRSLMPRLMWRRNNVGNWISDILDTDEPEAMMILPHATPDEPGVIVVREGVRLIVYRKLTVGSEWRTRAHTLGLFDDAAAAKEFARELVGDSAVVDVDPMLDPEFRRS